MIRKIFLLFICLNCLVACTSEQKESESKTLTVSQETSLDEEENFSETDSLPIKKDTITQNQKIIPGKSIGLIKLNEDAEVVHKLLGKPTTANSGMGKSLQTWIKETTDGKTYQLSIFFSRNMGNGDEKSRAKQIRITKEAFITKLNYRETETTLRANISEAKKMAIYTLAGSKDEFEIYDNMNAGIAFEFDPAGNVIAITVHEPGQLAFEIFTEVSSDLRKTKPSEQTKLPFPGIKD